MSTNPENKTQTAAEGQNPDATLSDEQRKKEKKKAKEEAQAAKVAKFEAKVF
jgi:hypothetical protein